MKSASTAMSNLWRLAWPLALALGTTAQAQVVFVNAQARAGGDGRSWSTAYNDLESALETPGVQQIFIARGTYKPSKTYSPSGVEGGAAGQLLSGAARQTALAGLKTFNIPDGVRLLGGFSGAEPDESARGGQWSHRSSNAGDDGLMPDWVPDPSATVLDGSASGSFHVVMVGDDVKGLAGMPGAGATVQLSDLTIRGGYAGGTDSGTLDPNFSITGINFAHDSGAGLYARYASIVTLNNVAFSNNTCDGTNGTVRGIVGEPLLSGGGAIFASDNGTVINVQQSKFTGNTSLVFGAGGGAINLVSNAALNVYRSSFTSNSCGRNGGAIRAKDAGDVHVTGCSFTDNQSATAGKPADEGGGAIGSIDGNLYVKDCVFTGNYGQIAGGAIFFHAPFDDQNSYFLTVKGSQFCNNLGGLFGGGAIIVLAANVHEGSYADIEDCSFTGNAAGQGGALYESSFNTVVRNSVFQGNMAAQWGGAVLADNLGDSLFIEPDPVASRKTLTVEDSTFDSNQVAGTLANLPTYPVPFDSTIDAVSVFAGAGPVLGAPDGALVYSPFIQSKLNPTGPNPPLFLIGGGAGSAIMAGELYINNCQITNNSVAPVTGGGAALGDGGGFLAGGVNGQVFLKGNPVPFLTLDYAAIHISDSVMTGNSPDDHATSDLMHVGSAEDQGVYLQVTP